MTSYDPMNSPDPEDWLEMDEQERIMLVASYHKQAGEKLPNRRLHATIHVIVENQIAEGVEKVRETLRRLDGEGLDRHDAIHAIGSVLTGHIWNLMREGPPSSDHNEPYFHDLESLTAIGWLKGAY